MNCTSNYIAFLQIITSNPSAFVPPSSIRYLGTTYFFTFSTFPAFQRHVPLTGWQRNAGNPQSRVCLCQQPLCLYTFFDLLNLFRPFWEMFSERQDNTVIHSSHMLKSRKPYKHLHSRSCWENKKLLRYFKPTVTFQFRHMSFLSYSLSKKTLYSFTMLPSSSCTCVLSHVLSTLSYVTWHIFHSDTFPQFIPSPFSVIQYTTFLSGFAVPHPGQRRVTLLVDNKRHKFAVTRSLCLYY
jgi:hypothetical protein